MSHSKKQQYRVICDKCGLMMTTDLEEAKTFAFMHHNPDPSSYYNDHNVSIE
jgi:hypothetical protein